MMFKWCLYFSESAFLWVFWISIAADAAAVNVELVSTGFEFRRRSVISDSGVSFCHLRVNEAYKKRITWYIRLLFC
jgi:hypothetical protein